MIPPVRLGLFPMPLSHIRSLQVKELWKAIVQPLIVHMLQISLYIKLILGNSTDVCLCSTLAQPTFADNACLDEYKLIHNLKPHRQGNVCEKVFVTQL